MKRQDSGIMLIGGLIVLAGVTMLLQNLGLLGPAQDLIWMVIFGVGGGAFLSVTARNTERWWALIPGMALLSIAGLIGLGMIAPSFSERWGGMLFLGGLSLAFWGIYALHRALWWAIIPGGVLTTLAVVAGMDLFAAEQFTGAALFFGIAATFALVYLTHDAHGRRTWALFVALVALIMSIVVIGSSVAMLGVIWPLIMIGAGLVLLVVALRRPSTRKEGEPYDNTTLPQSH